MRIPLLVLLLLLPSCAMARTGVNRPLDPVALGSLSPGVSTAADVVRILGAPMDVVQLGRRSAYRYEFINSKRAVLFLVVVGFYNQDTRADRAWVFFDENQVLTHVGVTLQGDQPEYAMPWEEVYD